MVILLELFLRGVWAFVIVFCACELGQQLSNAFEDVNDKFHQIKWYLLPMYLKKILPATMQYTQQTFAITFVGSHSCSREYFKKASFSQTWVLMEENLRRKKGPQWKWKTPANQDIFRDLKF